MSVSLSETRRCGRGWLGAAEGLGRVEGRTCWAGSSLTCCCAQPCGPGVWFPDYSHGITLVTPLSGSEKKQVLHFCALGSDEMQKFVEDLKESIAEVTELEQIRIECKDTAQSRLSKAVGREDSQRDTESALRQTQL